MEHGTAGSHQIIAISMIQGAKMIFKTQKPLLGTKFIITRAKDQAKEFSSLLRKKGAIVLEFPVISFEQPPDLSLLTEAIKNLGKYNWIIFTSVNGVKAFWENLPHYINLNNFQNLQYAAIGPATKKALKERGISVSLVPKDKFQAEGILNLFSDMQGQKVLIPRAEEARDTLIDGLREKGAIVDEVTAYQTVCPNRINMRILNHIKNHEVHAITFTSPSTVRNFVDILHKNKVDPHLILEQVIIACIGPVTFTELEKYGFTPQVMPSHSTIPELTTALIDYFNPFVYGITALQNGSFQDALQAFETNEEKFKKIPEYYSLKGTAQYFLGKFQEAVSSYKQAVAISPHNPAFYNDLGNGYLMAGQTEDAKEAYGKCLLIDPANSKGYFNMGCLYFCAGNYEEALKHFNEAIKCSPNEGEYYFRTGITMFAVGQLEEARSLCNKAAELNKENSEYLFTLGCVVYEQKDYYEALRYFARAIDLRPGDGRYHAYMGRTLHALGSTTGAIRAFDEATNLSQDNPRYYYFLGCLQFSASLHRQAVQSFNGAILLDPSQPDYHFSLGNALLGCGEGDKAIKSFKKAIELSPKTSSYHFNLGLAYYSIGFHDDFVLAMERALELDPLNEEFQKIYSELNKENISPNLNKENISPNLNKENILKT